MILTEAIKAIQNLPKRYEGDGNEYRNSPSCNLILKSSVIEIMTTYGLTHEDATTLKNKASDISEQNYCKARVVQDKYWQERESIKPTWFGSFINLVGFVIFVICCFGGWIGVIIGLIICGILGSIVEDQFSTKKSQSPPGTKTSPLVKDGDLEKFYWKMFQKRHK